MNHDIIEIDHLMCGVQDAQRAGASFERMGFRVTPLSAIEPMGLGNRCVLFQSATPGAACYLELMSILDHAKAPANMLRTLSGGERVKSMVMVTADCDACYQALLAGGFAPPSPPIHLQRDWHFPGGETVRPAFAVILPMPAPLTFNVCQHKTLPLYLRPDWTSHPNGALRLDSVIAVARDPDFVTRFYERLFGARAVRDASGVARVSPANVALRVGTAAALRAAIPSLELPEPDAAAYVGIGVRVASLAALRTYLDRSGVSYSVLERKAVVVPASAAHGNFIEFSEQT
jgi:catechol 2,3-dioxygenase-like lactoylglutathione lyase family enzyme